MIQSSFKPTQPRIELVNMTSGTYWVHRKEAGSGVRKHGRFVKQ